MPPMSAGLNKSVSAGFISTSVRTVALYIATHQTLWHDFWWTRGDLQDLRTRPHIMHDAAVQLLEGKVNKHVIIRKK